MCLLQRAAPAEAIKASAAEEELVKAVHVAPGFAWAKLMIWFVWAYLYAFRVAAVHHQCFQQPA